jgi:hypothetical protein
VENVKNNCHFISIEFISIFLSILFNKLHDYVSRDVLAFIWKFIWNQKCVYVSNKLSFSFITELLNQQFSVSCLVTCVRNIKVQFLVCKLCVASRIIKIIGRIPISYNSLRVNFSSIFSSFFRFIPNNDFFAFHYFKWLESYFLFDDEKLRWKKCFCSEVKNLFVAS